MIVDLLKRNFEDYNVEVNSYKDLLEVINSNRDLYWDGSVIEPFFFL